MSPRDRRIVHLVLQDDPSLSTKSSGKGYFRKVIIFPARTERGTRGDG
jgi:spoIIIJ-associated protein